MVRSSYLSVPRHTLITALASQSSFSPTDLEDWQIFTRAMAFIVSCSYSSVAESMRKLAWEEEAIGRSAAHAERRLQGQLAYMKHLMSLVQAAQYSPLADRHWQFGVMGQNYSDGQHVDVNEKKHKNSLFPAYFAPKEREEDQQSYWFGPDYEHELETKPPPDFAKYVLIFYRGDTVDIRTGRFFGEKLRWFAEHWRRKISRLIHFIYGGKLPPVEKPQTQYERQLFGDPQMERRVTVESILSEEGFFSKFFATLTLSEPAFQSLLVVYPAPDESKGDDSKGAAEKPRAADQDESEVSRVLRIEMFRKIPFRDLGLVIPGREVHMGFQHKLRFGIRFLIDCVFILCCFMRVRLQFDTYNILILCFLTFRTWDAIAVYFDWLAMRGNLQSTATDWLDQRRVASDNPCVARLMKQVEEQELKEILLGYFFLWKNAALTKRELDLKAEGFLRDTLQQELNFDVEDALRKLVQLRLAEKTNSGKYTKSRSPRKYLDDPRPQWLEFFHSFGKDERDEEGRGDGPRGLRRPSGDRLRQRRFSGDLPTDPSGIARSFNSRGYAGY
eukprot:Hpha_TRINITY_DN18343_c0_g1::TRINITY_DN18343_c0_g1_i1::g.158134::m.158134